MKYLCFDTETSCLNMDNVEIWQLSGKIIDLDNQKITNFNYNFNTKNPISYEARCRCSITPEIISKYPDFNVDAVINSLLLNEEDVYYIGHNVKYDRQVLMSVLSKYNISSSKYLNLLNDNLWIDTLKLAKYKYNDLIIEDIQGKSPISFRLDYLFHVFHLYKEDEELNFHNAAWDVEITWKLFKYLCKEIGLDIITNYKEISEISNRPILLKTFTFGKYKGQNIKEVYMRNTNETRSYFQWLASSEMCDPESTNCNEDLIYTLEQL